MMPQPIRVLELRSVKGTGGGPEKTIIQGAARTDRSRFAVTVCYLRDRRDQVFSIGDDASRLGVDYVEVQEAHSFDWRIVNRVRSVIRARQIEIVHAHEYKSDLLALILARIESVVPLATVHGWTGHTTRERWMYYPVDKRILARFPRLVAVSGEIRDELVRYGASPSRISVVLNGIDHRAFVRDAAEGEAVRGELGLRPDEYVIGAVGRAEPQKRFDLLLDVFAALLPKYSHLRLVIVGDGSLRSQLERRAADNGVAAACRFVGHRKDIVNLHSSFDLFVQSSDYEGTPNAVLEAMACETPVVATDVGGTRELARPSEEALIVPPNDPLALQRAIETSVNDTRGARRRATRARVRVEGELSFARRMERLERIYVELAAREGANGELDGVGGSYGMAAR